MLFWFCLLIPLVGTLLGAVAVFFIKRKQGARLSAALDGVASGVMVASAIFSLLLPAFDTASSAFVPLFGLFIGFLFFFGIERLCEHLSASTDASKLSAFAITLHNLPEGMAVGISLGGLLAGTVGMTAEGVLMLSLGIAIQNIPEGAVVSLPLVEKGKGHAFSIGALSGVIEPLGALTALFLSELAASVLPFLLAFAAAAMFAVATCELSASFHGEGETLGRAGFAIGFFVMTALDVLLS